MKIMIEIDFEHAGALPHDKICHCSTCSLGRAIEKVQAAKPEPVATAETGFMHRRDHLAEIARIEAMAEERIQQLERRLEASKRSYCDAVDLATAQGHTINQLRIRLKAARDKITKLKK